jgi:outer membrane immunogenic protein
MGFKSLVATAMAIGLVALQSTNAADMPVTASAYDWTGFYTGANIGYGWRSGSDQSLSLTDRSGSGLTEFRNAGGFPVGGVDPDGIVGGGQAGYNWQSSAWVWGIVADFQAAGLEESRNFASTAPAHFLPGTTVLDRKIDWFGTVRGKAGWATQNWLFYGTGGLAYGHVAENLAFTSAGVASARGSNSNTKIGWTAGAGLEYGWGGWSVGAEYLYIDLGRTSPAMTFAGYSAAGGDSITASSRNNMGIVRALVNYRF